MAKFLLTNVKTADFCRATSLLPKCTRMHQSIIPRKIFRGNIPGYPHWVPYLREGKAGGKGRRWEKCCCPKHTQLSPHRLLQLYAPLSSSWLQL